MLPQRCRITVIILSIHLYLVLAKHFAYTLRRPLTARGISDIVGDGCFSIYTNCPVYVVAVVFGKTFGIGNALRFKPDQRFHAVLPRKIRRLEKGLIGPFAGIQLPGSDRIPPIVSRHVRFGTCTVRADIPSRVKPSEIYLCVFGNHFFQRRTPRGMALGYTSVRIWQSRIIGKTAGGERLKITAARIRLRHIISDKPITPEICGKMLISHHIRSEYKQCGAYFFAGLQICFQPVD